jgi:DNA-binding GntR family transcriptional regulator
MKGKAGLLVLGEPEPDDDDEKPKGDSKPSGSMSATKALLKAIKADDAAAADKALKLHYELCSAESDEDY